MDFKIGDLVTRNSYNNDIVFRIIEIDEFREKYHDRQSIVTELSISVGTIPFMPNK